MKKKLLIIFGSVAVVGIIVFAIFKFKSSEGQLKFIPKESFMVMSIDLKSLSGKIDKEKVKDLKWYKELTSGGMSKDETGKIILEALEKPEISGINFLSNPYLAIVSKDSKSFNGPTGILSIKLEDGKSFQEFIERFKYDKKPNIEGVDNALLFNNELLVAYNSDYAVFILNEGENAEKRAKDLFSLKENITDIPSFSDFQSLTKDFGLFVNYSQLEDMMRESMSNMPIDISDMYKDMNMTMAMALNFEMDKISVKMNTAYLDDKTKEKYKDLYKEGLSEEHLKCVTDKNIFAYLGIAFNSGKIVEMISQVPMVKAGMDEFKTQMGMTDADLKEILGGEISVGMVDVKEVQRIRENYDFMTMEPYMDTVNELMPIFTGTVSTSNRASVEKLISKLPLMKLSNSLWKMPMPEFDVYMALSNKQIFFVNDSLLAVKFSKDQKLSAEVPEKIKSLASSNSSSFYFNMNLKDYPECLSNKLKENGDKFFDQFRKVTGNFKDIVVKSNIDESSMEVNFTEGKENTLMRLLSIAE